MTRAAAGGRHEPEGLTLSAQTPDPSITPPVDLLGEAVGVLTAAARAGWDWAEFVALACAGAAANIGGVEEILSRRSGSWEASFVRDLLVGTVADDETSLWAHRTEPVRVTVNVPDLLADIGSQYESYDEAAAELDRRAEAAATPTDAGLYVWTYHKVAAGEWVAQDPAAPPWSRDDWRAGVVDQGIDPDDLAALDDAIDQPNWVNALLVPKYPGALTDLALAEQAGEDAAGPWFQAISRLEQQRLQEWQAFGEQLADRIRVAAPVVLPGLTVPVEVTVVVDDPDPLATRGEPEAAAQRLLDAVAYSDEGYPTTPADLPGTPLSRLGVDNP